MSSEEIKETEPSLNGIPDIPVSTKEHNPINGISKAAFTKKINISSDSNELNDDKIDVPNTLLKDNITKTDKDEESSLLNDAFLKDNINMVLNTLNFELDDKPEGDSSKDSESTVNLKNEGISVEDYSKSREGIGSKKVSSLTTETKTKEDNLLDDDIVKEEAELDALSNLSNAEDSSDIESNLSLDLESIKDYESEGSNNGNKSETVNLANTEEYEDDIESSIKDSDKKEELKDLNEFLEDEAIVDDSREINIDVFKTKPNIEDLSDMESDKVSSPGDNKTECSLFPSADCDTDQIPNEEISNILLDSVKSKEDSKNLTNATENDLSNVSEKSLSKTDKEDLANTVEEGLLNATEKDSSSAAEILLDPTEVLLNDTQKKLLNSTEKVSSPRELTTELNNNKNPECENNSDDKNVEIHPSKKRRSSKDKYFLEALNFLENEDPLLSPSKVLPLKPSAEIPSIPPAKSLTVLDSSSSEKKGGVKRSISDASESESELKKVKIFKNNKTSKQKGRIPESMEVDNVATEAATSKEKTSLTRIDSEEVEHVTESEKMRIQNNQHRKLRRIKRKDLESLVIQLFMDKVLYEHELGNQRDLCKRLEATLEMNRKKAAQFHKDMDDLKKVTQRLIAEHTARKKQIINPVKVKRSVGIQATPSIINKGFTTAATSTSIKLMSPTRVTPKSNARDISSNTKVSTVSSNHVSQPKSTYSSMQTQTLTQYPSPKLNASRSSPSKTTAIIAPKISTQNTTPTTTTVTPNNVPSQVVMVNPQLVVQQQQSPGGQSTLMPVTRVVPIASQQGTQAPIILQQATAAPKAINSAIIDLTDDEDVKARPGNTPMVTIPRAAATSVTNNTNQFLTLPIKTTQQTGTSVSQLFLVPASGSTGSPATAIVVPSAAGAASTLQTTQLRTTSSTLRNPQIIGGSPTVVPITGSRQVGNKQANRVVVGNTINGANIGNNKHPAPLPKAPPQQLIGFSKKLPPQPMLKLSHRDSSIILSWNMIRSNDHEQIASYQLYAYQEGSAPPTSNLWKKVGSVKALELPMACTLTQFLAGHVYHFAVRAVDTRSRLGPFSEPRSIRLK